MNEILIIVAAMALGGSFLLWQTARADYKRYADCSEQEILHMSVKQYRDYLCSKTLSWAAIISMMGSALLMVTSLVKVFGASA